MKGFNFFAITSMPNIGLNKQLLMEAIGKREFVLVYDFSRKITLIGLENTTNPLNFRAEDSGSIPGFSIEASDFNISNAPIELFCCYKQPSLENPLPAFTDIFSADFKAGFVCVAFLPLNLSELECSKRRIERLLSSKNLKETSASTSGMFNSKTSLSVQRELFDGSEERLLLEQMLGSINNSLLSNGMTYKIFVAGQTEQGISEYLESRVLILKHYGAVKAKGADELLASIRNLDALPVGSAVAELFLNVYGSYRLGYAIRTQAPYSSGDLEIGSFLKDGASRSNIRVSIARSSLNLGFILTGLPGSGKTREAMAITDSIMAKNPGKQTAVIVISPTSEWNSFAGCHGMYKITVGDGKLPINFFSCPEGVEKRVFYENLAMILSSASNAGPYQNPMEKCMLNAFRAAYKDTNAPNPINAYDELENSIIKFHAKRTNSGVKYTKHGENIRSALENLRAILSLPEYSVSNGIDMQDIASKGVVFDLSKVSSGSKAYLYALLLNQIYALSSLFDLAGDDELRMLVCVEESQLIFGNKESAALQDIKQRIQDFRKQGIGLMLLTHNVTDIDPSLRRLCQTKLYLKQAPDVAQIAAKDMVFTHAKDEEVVLKLKLLESGTGAFSYVTKLGQQKLPNDTIFLSTRMYEDCNKLEFANLDGYLADRNLKVPSLIKSNISIKCYSEEDLKLLSEVKSIRFVYLNETVFECDIERGDKVAGLLEGKEYHLQVLSRKGKIIIASKMVARDEIVIQLSGGNVSQK
ncbi:MAG TPA: hypothetical protein VND15_02010 [Candidatus Acidoferrales bacterium]|nr:hypothetical protein [Candidatus Acidoferrales bacterium]